MFGRGCGTGLAGQSVNEAVMFDFSKYMREILELDPDRKLARVQPGIVLDRLRERAEQHDLTFGPDPATHSRCTLGGMIGNNSCGIGSQGRGAVRPVSPFPFQSVRAVFPHTAYRWSS